MGPLLATKLHVPRRRRGQVARARLATRLDEGAAAALTLVSAPAGFGKTTVLTEWLARDPAPAAWLSLDERDADPAVFWSYVLAALRTVAPELPQPDPADLDAFLTALVNGLAGLDHAVVLVLDDYHLVTAPRVQEGMTFLVEHLPAQVQLVLATRADPALPLARWRSRGELVEIRAADLRFTAAEAAEYLDGMGLALSADHVAVLEGRTEGWIAALQLAALSLQGRDDVPGFIGEFAGDDRYIVDYLVEEVLQRLPEAQRGFLLQTSVLGRMTAELCDAVTGRADGATVLAELERANLFLVPLDNRRRWYRYHHLFADVLQVRLRAEQPDALPGLHRRAAEWFEGHGERAEAVEHALAGGDMARAAELIELTLPALQRSRQEATMRRWLEALPDEVVRARPMLAVGHAGALMISGEPGGVEARLQAAEQALAIPEPPAADASALGRLPGAIALYRAGLALLSGDLAGADVQAGTAFDLAGPDDPLGRGAAAGIRGLARWTSGNLDEGYRWWAESAAGLEAAGHHADLAGCALATADIRLAQGRLGDAAADLERAMRMVSPEGGTPLRGAADLHVGLAGILLERGDLDGARRRLAAAEELGDRGGLPQNPYRRRVVTARLREIEGDPDGALGLLDEAERLYVGDFFPQVRPVPALRAQLAARRGRGAEALAWADGRRLSVADDLDYLHEFEHLTLARALVAAGREAAGALALLDRLHEQAEAGGRTGTVIAVLVVRALAEQARGAERAALAALERALALAEPHGHVRVFLDEGPPMTALLGAATGYARTVLARPGARTSAGLVVPLSARELDVLRLLGTELDGPDIARRLFVSVNTVRTHTKNIYAKLGVSNRRAAVRRGAELDLLNPR